MQAEVSQTIAAGTAIGGILVILAVVFLRRKVRAPQSRVVGNADRS
jgi:hypothetical protein